MRDRREVVGLVYEQRPARGGVLVVRVSGRGLDRSGLDAGTGDAWVADLGFAWELGGVYRGCMSVRHTV